VPFIINATVRVQSSLKRQANQMTDAICRILDKGDIFPSAGLGDHYCVMENISQVQEDQLAKGLYVGAVNLKILGKVWKKPAPEPTELVQEIVCSVTAQFTCNLNLPPHLRNVYREATVIGPDD
ncbi:MAG TPA: hypothetical protein VMZ50_06695, partial [Phycisphaerae bacterium]|nr:hypothetical protein [Phycisphaerae bacterium]